MRHGAHVRFAVLGSGSKGNSLVIEGGGVCVLVDAGYSPRELRRRLSSLDVDLRAVTAVLITHGHGDHVKGARQLAGALGIPTYATEQTRRFCSTFTSLKNVVPIAPNEAFSLGGLRVLPVPTSHDAPGSVCFVVDDGDQCVGVCTDLGVADPMVGAALRAADALVLEHNHDAEMLQKGPYPAHLKRRIASERGHLSNEAGARLLALSAGPQLSRVLLAHLSEVNNTPALALRAARGVVDGRDVELSIAPQHHPTGWLRPKRRQADRTVATTSSSSPPPAVSAAERMSQRLRRAVAQNARVDPAQPSPVLGRHVALERQLALFSGPSTKNSPPPPPTKNLTKRPQ